MLITDTATNIYFEIPHIIDSKPFTVIFSNPRIH